MTSPISLLNRRHFLAASATSAAALALAEPLAQGATTPSDPLRGRMLKTLKIGMIGVQGSLVEKFKAAKAAGFDGVELSCPGNNVAEVRQAAAESGLRIDGSVCSSHWQVRHSDADPAVRAKALSTLQDAIRETHAAGGHTVLLVVGHGKDGTPEEVWKRSVESIRPAIALAAEVGVSIAIENVWNHFLYDHEGPATQTADQFVKYVDEFNSPWVGMQFDIGNHWKYGSMGNWIRQLGKRIVKLDVKGFSRAEDKFTDIGEGDIDWADVRKALVEINFHGWVAAEVKGGDADRLKTIASQMDQVFAL